MVFNVEAVEAAQCGPGKGYVLLKNGRFGYTKEYISALFDGHLEVVK